MTDTGWSCEFNEERERLIEMLHEYGENYAYAYDDMIDGFVGMTYDEFNQALANANDPAWFSEEEFDEFCQENGFENEEWGDECGLWRLWLDEASPIASDKLFDMVQERTKAVSEKNK